VAPSGGQVDTDSSIAPSAFATATATAAVTGQWHCRCLSLGPVQAD
jgi:hypothetical protein